MATTEDNESQMLAYVFGEMSASDARSFEQRMDADAALRAEVESMRATHQLFGKDADWGVRSGTDLPPPHLVDAIVRAELLARAPEVRAALHKREAPSGTLTARLSRWLIGGGVLIGATAVVFIVFTKTPEASMKMAPAPTASSMAASEAPAAPMAPPAMVPPAATASARMTTDGAAPRREQQPSDAPADALVADKNNKLAERARVDAEPPAEVRLKSELAADEKKLEKLAPAKDAQQEDAAERVMSKHASAKKSDTYRYEDNDVAKAKDVASTDSKGGGGKTGAKADSFGRGGGGTLGGDASVQSAAPLAGASSGMFAGEATKKPAEEKPMAATTAAPKVDAKASRAPAKSAAPKPSSAPMGSSTVSATPSVNAAPPPPPAPSVAAASVAANDDAPGGVLSQGDLDNARKQLLLKREAKGKDKKRTDADRAHRDEASALALATGMRELDSKNYASALDELQRAESIDTDQALGAQPQTGEMKALLGLRRGADAGRIARRLSSRDAKVPGIGDAWLVATNVAQQIGDTTLERDLWTRLLDVPAHRAEAQAALAKLSSSSHYPAPAPNRSYKAKASAADFADESATAPAAAAPPPADAESAKAK